MKKWILILLLLLVYNAAKPCDCILRDLHDAAENATMIFQGKVKDISEDGDERLYTFNVNKAWKGEMENEVVIAQGETVCYLVEFSMDTEYIIFSEGYSVHNCSRSRLLKFSNDMDRLDVMFEKQQRADTSQFTNNDRKYIQNILSYSGIESVDIESTEPVFVHIEDKLHIDFYNKLEFARHNHLAIPNLKIISFSDSDQKKTEFKLPPMVYTFGYYDRDDLKKAKKWIMKAPTRKQKKKKKKRK
ncbi:MAG: hypothetical protein AAFX87_24765 [Bacteroidota bacterium]